MPDPVVISIERNQQITIRPDGGVRVGIHDIGVKVGKDDTLVLTGNGAGSSLDIDPKFAPRIKLMTSEPLLIRGSFTLSGESIQSAQADVTPIELTSMTGVDSKKTTNNPDRAAAATTPKVTKYDLATPDGKLTENAKAGTKTLAFGNGSGKKIVTVERGARVDFVNSREGSRQLFTFLGSDSFSNTDNRYRIARGEAMSDVKRTLDIESPLSLSQFEREKEKYGIPGAQQRGVVEYKSPGRVNLAMPAVLPYGVTNTTPATGDPAVATEAAPVTSSQESPEQRLGLRKEVESFAQRHLANNATKAIMSGKYDHDAKGGQDLKVMFTNIQSHAAAAVSEDGTVVNKQKLGEMHAEIARFEDTIDRMAGDAIASMKKNKFIPAGTENDPSKWKKDNVPGWLYDRTQEMKKEIVTVQNKLEGSPSLSRKAAYSGKIGMLDVPDDRKPFDKLAIPGDMPKLASADVSEAPAPLAGAMPRIEEFLKRKIGGKGAA